MNELLKEVQEVIKETLEKLSVGGDFPTIRELQGYIRGLRELETIIEKLVEDTDVE